MHLDTHIQQNDPYSILPHYRELTSGNKDEDKAIYRYAYPQSAYPILHLGFPIYDDIGNKLDPGHYEIALSFDKKYLLIIQSKKLIAKVPVIKFEFDEDAYNEAAKKADEIKGEIEKYQIRHNRKKANQYKLELEYLNNKILARNKVKLDYSHSEYFVLYYYCNYTSAIGFIKRASQD